jgi:hypothetical protein
MAIIIPAKRKFLAPPLVRTIDDRRDPLNLGLVGHWTMDAETINGTRMLDLSGRDRHGQLFASPPIVPGRVGQALSFNGTTQYAYLMTSPLAPFTVSAWALSASDAIVSAWDINFCFDFLLLTTDFYALDNTTPPGSIRHATNATSLPGWHLYTGTIDASNNTYLYIDGVPGANGGVAFANTASFSGTHVTAALGTRQGPVWSNETVDDVRIYNRALTPAEVWRLYNNPTRERVPYQTRGRLKAGTGLSAITGTLAVTEAADTIAAVGRVAVGGTLAVTEANDTINAAGAVRVAGTLAASEQADTLAATGTVTSPGAITGTLSALQAVQTLIATGQIRVIGGLNVTQAAQTLAATGIVGSIVPPPSGQSVQVIVMS